MRLNLLFTAAFAGMLFAGSSTQALGFARAQFDSEPEPAAGKLLVASEKLRDPNFNQTVILLLQYDSDDGSLGLILNRRTEVLLTQVFPGKDTRKDPIYLGGPVDVRAVQALLRSPEKTDHTTHIIGDVYASATKSVIEKSIKAHAEPSRFRLYLGYAGWQPGQLEAEIKLGAWYVVNTANKAVFDENPDSLWLRLHAAASGQIARVQRRFALLSRR